MRIAIISSIYKPTTPNATGGQEVWTANFASEIIKRNYLVDLYALSNSLHIEGRINLIELSDKGMDQRMNDEFFLKSDALQKDKIKLTYSIYAKAILSIKQKESYYDLVVDSSGVPLFTINWEQFNKPLFVIGHFPVNTLYTRIFTYLTLPKNVFFIFPSLFQNRTVNWITNFQKYVIPHGITINNLPLSEKHTDSMFWVGRIDPLMPKGLIETIEIAKRTYHSLQIYGYIQNKDYFEQQIQPLIHDTNIYINTEQHNRKDIFNEKKLMLFPIQWEEPFGLVMIESMACGTPVVAYARGAVLEIIKDGITGFIVNSSEEDKRGDWIVQKTGIDGLCEAVEKIYSMPEEQYRQMRKNCRAHVEEYFTVERMVDDYEKLFQQITNIK